MAQSFASIYEGYGLPLIKANHNLPEEELKQCAANMHFTASETLEQMLVDFILSSNDISLHGLAEYFRNISEGDIVHSSPAQVRVGNIPSASSGSPD